jgi:hypothetical protein
MARFSGPSGSSNNGGAALSYVQVAGTQQTISTAPNAFIDLDITTTGKPVQISVTGEGNNASASSWVRVNLFRDNTAIGNEIQIEASDVSENVPFAINFIDDVAAGTYNYSARVTSKSDGNWQFGESAGPVMNAVELTGFKGDDGDAGASGADGEDGASAYDIAVENGFEGTEQEWLDSLVGGGSGGDIADFIFTNNGGDSTITLPGAKVLSIISGEEEDLFITAGDDLYLTALDDDVHVRANDDVRFLSGYENGGTEYDWSMDSDGRFNLPGEGYISNPVDSSGDGNSYDTIQIVPDDSRYGSDQYLIVDPTAPNHIHIRAGGTIDESLADLIIGGENTHVKVSDADGSVSILADDISITSYLSPSSLSVNTYDGIRINSNRTSAYSGENKIAAVLGDVNAVVPANTAFIVNGGSLGTMPTFDGDPLFSGTYVKTGPLVHFQIQVDMDNITSFGSGQYYVDLPFPAKYNYLFRNACLHDVSMPRQYGLSGHVEAGQSRMLLFYTDTSGQDYAFDYNSPALLTVNDNFHISGDYILDQSL